MSSWMMAWCRPKRPFGVGQSGLLAGGDVHARQPVFAGEDRLLRVCHVDGDEDVVGEAVEQRRGVGPAAADVPEAVQAGALDRHEADLPRVAGLRDVVDRHAGRPVAAALVGLGVVVDRALVVVLLVGHLGLGEHVLVVDDEEQVVVRLQMQRPGVGRRGDVFHRFGLLRVAHVDDREALGEDVADIGEAVDDHDLHAVAAAVLVGCSRRASCWGWRSPAWEAPCRSPSELRGGIEASRRCGQPVNSRM